MVVSRYRDVALCLRHPGLSSAEVSAAAAARPGGAVDTCAGLLRRQLDLIDPPRHSIVRRIFSPAFGGARLARLRGVVETWVANRVRRLPPVFDVMSEIARPLPLEIVRHVLGAPLDIWRPLSEQIDRFVAVVNDPTADLHAASPAIGTLRGLLSNAMRHPDLDPGGAIALGAAAIPEALDLDDLLANVVLIYAAGHLTTTHLIGNGVLLLLTHPEQAAVVSSNPHAWVSTVEEILRFESPVQVVRRMAVEPLRLDGRAIAPGESVTLFLGAANRSPEAFGEPDRFDVRRRDNPHLAFGFGHHVCLGAQIARLQGTCALRALLPLGLTLRESQPPWMRSTTYRGLERLIVGCVGSA
jgi:hypothetical protein